MIIFVYSETNSVTIEENFGKSEYSYFFVLKEFVPVLQKIGTVVSISDPLRELDQHYHRARESGEECVFLSFSPPHRTPLDLACPTVPVFAWEFDTIPAETWCGEQFQDWRFVLNKTGRAITHSSFAVQAVQRAMGADFPIASIPAPVWDRFSGAERSTLRPQDSATSQLSIIGTVIDSRAVDWTTYKPRHQRLDYDLNNPGTEMGAAHPKIEFGGVVYTSIFSPYDGRKNFPEMLGAFCRAFGDVEDATLIFKLIHHASRNAIHTLMDELYRHLPFKCRVILIDSFLNDLDYERLMLKTTYAVNASSGEGQCLPLMEYMSAGKPAVAPRHTAMADYLSADNAFLIDTTAAPAIWPHDVRGAYRALSRRIDCESLVRAFRESYRVAKEYPERYRAMSANAREALKQHCSAAVTEARLRSILAAPPRPPVADPVYGRIVPRNIDYRLAKPVNFAKDVDARRHLFAGWSHIELGYGVWSDGTVAELAFRIDPPLSKPLRLRMNVSPFLNEMHPDMKIDVSANDVGIGQWKFNHFYRDQISESWVQSTIPADVAASGEIRIRLLIDQPASPWELGISSDERALGIALHELAIVPMRDGR